MSTNIMSLDVLWHEYDMLKQASKKLNYASVNDFVKAAALKVSKDTVTNDNITELRQTSTSFNNYAVESLGNFVASQHESKSALTKLSTMLEFDDSFDITVQMFFNTNDKLYNLHNFKSSTLQESLKYHKCLKYANAFYVKHDYSLQQ